MNADPIDAAGSAGLRYVTDARPGIRRLRHGKGFRYVDASGAPVRDQKVLDRIRILAIPPAWTDVWICASPSGHLQATGRDARGRKQYRYHPEWRRTRDETKYAMLPAFARALPAIREQVETDLRQPGLSRTRVIAVVVALLDETGMRIGNERYARENDSYGLTTLRDRHVRARGNGLRVRFAGKSGKVQEFGIDDRRMIAIVRRCRELPGQTLFQYLDDDGDVCEIESADVNDYLRQITGQPVTAKDFRTWAGTKLAVEALCDRDPPESAAEADRQIVKAVDAVAGALGNTRAVCRASYIHPAVFEAWRTGALQELSRRSRRWTPRGPHGLDTMELLTQRLIEGER
jgi:DNA topoisomerase-1